MVPASIGVEHLVDVLIDEGILAKALAIALGGELARWGSRRLPLVGPDGFEGACGRHGELRMRGIAIAPKAQAEASNAGEKARPPE